MRAETRSPFSLLTFGLAGWFSITSAAIATAQDSSPCQDTALVVREANRHEAWADAWLKVTTCINDSGCPLAQYLQVVVGELLDDLDLAQEQYDARLEACEDLGSGAYDPKINPSEFSPNVDSSYFPLVPGRTLVYEEHSSSGTEHSEFTALDQIQVIAGVSCRVVSDVVTIGGVPIEDTLDFFAQHQSGTVWYFGEIAKNFDHGLLDNLDGSWRTGKNGAKPGIVMLAAPAEEDVYRQEFLSNEAEDIAEVLSLDETVTVPYGTFDHCLETEESTPLEPGASTLKFYAPGIGVVLEIDLQSGARTELMDIR